MDERELLARLSALAGIVPAYTDNWGQTHAASAATQRALLTAMGMDVSSMAAIDAAIDAQQQRPWRCVLEPVRVVRQAPPWVRLVWPDTQVADELTWRLVLEEGGERSARFQPMSLAPLESQPVDGADHTAWKLTLDVDIPPGYHRLELSRAGEPVAAQVLIVAPPVCYRPLALADTGRVWGPAVQLYAVRSERQWGMGDFTDLRLLLEQWAGQGADVIGLNPVHALFPHHPEHASPYSPSSRLFLNVLYLDVEAVADFHECDAARALLRAPEFQMRLESLRATEMVDYAGVAALKLPALEMLYRHFRERHLASGSERATAFAAFRAREGERLYRHTLFEALQEHFHHQDPAVWGWPVWPPDYRDPDAEAVRAFAQQNGERIEFFAYLQWQADLQLGAVGLRALELGLGVGLYLDLAISVDGGGAEAWSHQALYAMGVGVGAPPELHNQRGQDWGLPPFVPQRLREAAYAPFIATLRHNMHHAGALRLDHVMGLMRQYWVPAGMPATDGAYVLYPFEDLLGILALESQRNHCLVIGEDLGTVPDAVRAALAPLDVFSYRLLILEKDAGGAYVPPTDYPAQALAAVTTHDLPTLAGYWDGRDLVRRTELQLFSTDEARQAEVVARAQDRAYLLLALERAGLLPADVTVNPISLPAVTPEFALAVHTYLARSPAKLCMLQLEDMLGVMDQINIPSTTTQHPNWRRKLPVTVESCSADRRVLALAAALRQERPRQRLAAAPPVSAAHIPLATYRLQFNRQFTFAQATQLVPYLAQLGVSHVYCSPYLRARPGSTHGYDIIDHSALNPEIGDMAQFDAFCGALRAHGMGQILDVVPNHMGVMGADNQWWLDVLENGPASVYAPFFDIDWQPYKDELRGKILLPILGRRYGEVLESGELRLEFDRAHGNFSVWYHQHRLPVAPRSYPSLLRHRYALLEAQLGPEHADALELASIITAFENLPPRDVTAAEKILERHRDRELIKRRLAGLVDRCVEIERMLQDTVNDYNGKPDQPGSFVPLHQLMEAQPWRIADWHVASDDINYRRFFDINELAALRMEDSRVFEATHQFVFDLVAAGKVDGLRVDHPDGLYDPAGYFQRLQQRGGRVPATQGAVTPLYVLAEKILAQHEPLREDWAIHGTTGYDFSNLLTRLFVDPRGEAGLERAYHAALRERLDFDELVHDSKRLIMKRAMASELNVLAVQLSRVCELSPYTRDFTVNNLRHALGELIAYFPVYRTYVRDGQVSALDRRYVEWAVARARKNSRVFDTGIFEFIGTVLLLDAAVGKDAAYQAAVTAVAMKFQQLSSPVMAKGCEDTAFYLYHRLTSLNEVGGDPRHFFVSVKAFHTENIKRHERWPYAMLNTSTHDSKRSEDVRACISVLSEIPQEWQRVAQRWRQINRQKKHHGEHGLIPTANDEYLLYQTLLGTWPQDPATATTRADYLARIEAYMLKAVREAKQHSSWINPDAAYEDALSTFVRRLLEPADGNAFLADFVPFQRRVARWGWYSALSQVFLKLTVPGVPDIYQGNEVWDFSLVDPDNRRPVDYDARRGLLEELKKLTGAAPDTLAATVRGLCDTLHDGRAKLYLTWRLLQARHDWPSLFQEGDYQPLDATGPYADHLCAFARRAGEMTLIAVAPRWFARLAPEPGDLPLGTTVWHDTEIAVPCLAAGARGVNVLTGETVVAEARAGVATVAAGSLLASFPVALVRC
jgi:(1->4)-alpha-D-glucan 1-alpha-D-glucosylmutase